MHKIKTRYFRKLQKITICIDKLIFLKKEEVINFQQINAPSSIQYAGIKTFYLLEYRNILSPKFIKILNHIKSFYVIFYAKLILIFWNILTRKIRHENWYTTFYPKMFQYPHIAYYRRTLLQPVIKNRFIVKLSSLISP